MKNLYLPEIVGRGYRDFWEFKGRYRVCKGSRASKKSKTAALNLIVRMMMYPQANLLVVRKVFRTLKDSCYAELRWAINRLGAGGFWQFKESPLEMVYIPTGQKIYFRGLDDPLKVASITVENGALCWLWIEEAYEIAEEADFDMLDESIRGEMPRGLFKQVTVTFNPWNERHWLKRRFFDRGGSEVLAKSTNYMCNEFLDEADIRLFENMRRENPRRYKVAGLGEWGVVEGLIYENWEEAAFDIREVTERDGVRSVFGLDFGYVNDPSALFCGLVDKTERAVYVFDELYQKALLNSQIYERVRDMGYAGEVIRADCAEPKSIQELKRLGLQRIRAARKGKDSVNNGIQYIQNYRIIVHPRCVNFLTEIGNYVWEADRSGGRRNEPAGGFDHLMDAMRYAMEDVIRGENVSFK